MNATNPMGSYVSHDESYFPSLVQVGLRDRGTYLSPEALQLAQSVADKVKHVAINGPAIVDVSTTSDQDAAALLSRALHRVWLIRLRKPIPDQKFPLEEAA